jgi:hypothetical protein
VKEPNLGPDAQRYAGFRVHWDKDRSAFVFDSKDERDRWQIRHYGQVRNCWREEHEPPDDRPLIVYRRPFWKDEEERRRWEKAAAACPVKESGSLKLDEYLAEVVKVARAIPTGPRGEW